MIVFNHDPVLSYLLEHGDIHQSSPYMPTDARDISINTGDCLVIAKTYSGALGPEATNRLYKTIDPSHLRRADRTELNPDDYYLYKSRIAHEPFPSHYLVLEFSTATDSIQVPDWYALSILHPENRPTE